MSTIRNKRTVRRVRFRYLLPLALLALGAILLAPTGSAKPTPVTQFEVCVQNANGTPTPVCGGVATSVFTGNTTATVKVSVENDSTSTTAIQSANVNLPNQLRGVTGSGLPATNVTVASAQQVQIRGVKVQPGHSYVATFQANVACGGQATWPVQQAFSDDPPVGTGFTYQSGSSTGVSTTITTGCYLGFVGQPTDTQNGSKISAGGASQGGDVTVGLFKASDGSRMSSCPTGFSPCSVTVDKAPVDGSLSNGADSLSQPLTGSPLVATYSNLSITIANTPEQFRLRAAGDGDFAPRVNSGSFLIADDVSSVGCTGGQCSVNQKQLKHTGLADSFADLAGVQNFNFMTLSPFVLSSTPQGCEGRIALPVAGFAESDSRSAGSGALTIRYYVNHDVLKAKYGVNVGQQFIAICAGGRPVDTATGIIYDCNDPNSPVNHDVVGGKTQGWLGDEVKNGKFTGKTANAVCNDDGYYWGIIGSYQDKLPAGNPIVTNWGGQNIGGDNYRFFDITIPPGWDWRSGP